MREGKHRDYCVASSVMAQSTNRISHRAMPMGEHCMVNGIFDQSSATLSHRSSFVLRTSVTSNPPRVSGEGIKYSRKVRTRTRNQFSVCWAHKSTRVPKRMRILGEQRAEHDVSSAVKDKVIPFPTVQQSLPSSLIHRNIHPQHQQRSTSIKPNRSTSKLLASTT